MTEYDFSPEAYDAYIRKQHQIARWVDKTNRAPALRDPFTAATPALRARDIDQDDHRDRRRHNHRRHTSVDHTAYQRDQYAKDRDRERDRDRDRDRDRERDRPRDRDKERYNSASPTRLPPKRHRSASHAAVSPPLPDNTRKYSVPPPLPLPAQYPAVHSPTQPFQQPQHPYPSRMISPRDSRHSSHSSSTQIPSPTSYYPQQQPPYSAPVYKSTHAPVRSQTAPNYYFQEPNYPYPSQYHQSQNFYPVKPTQYDNFNPYPYSAQQPKQPPLLKRIFMGLTGGNKQHHKVPRRKRSSSF